MAVMTTTNPLRDRTPHVSARPMSVVTAPDDRLGRGGSEQVVGWLHEASQRLHEARLARLTRASVS